MRSSTGQPKSHGSLLNGTKNRYEYELLHFFVSIKTDFYVMHFSRKIFRMQKKELLFINTLIKGCDSSETVLFWQKVLKVPQTGERQQQVCVCAHTCVCLCVCKAFTKVYLDGYFWFSSNTQCSQFKTIVHVYCTKPDH